MSKKLSRGAYGGVAGKDYEPYLSGNNRGGGLVILILGIIMAIIFAASTAYSGMKVGLTVAAGIPGAILGSGLLAVFAKQKGICSKNLLQGMSSGGESIASGIIFVLPAIFVIGAEIGFFEAFAVGVAGMLFGVGAASLVQNYLLVEEHGKLMYPESIAISETLVASEGAGESMKLMLEGFGIGGIITFFTSAVLNKINNVISFVSEKSYKWKFEMEVSPMMLGLGFIVGTEISVLMFAGSILANFAVLPLIGYFCQFAADGQSVWNAGTMIKDITTSGIGGSYLKYMGAGMMLSGGFISAVKLIPTIVGSIKKTLSAKQDSSSKGHGGIILVLGIILAFIAAFIISGSIVMAILVGFVSLILSLLFVIVSGRLTGTIGTSNLPVSGMTIAAIVVITLIYVVSGWKTPADNKSLLLFGTFIVTAIAMAGGYAQSQKTTFLLGGDLNEMQRYITIASFFGVITVVGVIALLANQLKITGSEAPFQIPQANLMATLTQGIMEGRLPWSMVISGVVFGIFFYLAKLPVMTVGIGFYLSISTTSIILIGALIRVIIEKIIKEKEKREAVVQNGVSLSSGLVAGSSIVGLVGIILQVTGIVKQSAIQGFLASNVAACVLLGVMIITVMFFILRSKPAK